MQTEVDVPNPTLTLVPGMYAEVDLTTEQRKNVLSVPMEAIDGSGDSARVYTVEPDPERSQSCRSALASKPHSEIEVRSGDLKDGDSVVVGSRSGLKAGNKVQPKVIGLAADPAPKS